MPKDSKLLVPVQTKEKTIKLLKITSKVVIEEAKSNMVFTMVKP